MAITQKEWEMAQSLWTLQSHATMATGELSWNLPQRTPHEAGAVMEIAFTIKNKTAAARPYLIYFGLFDLSGPVLMTWVWPAELVVEAGGEETFILTPRIDYSDCILQASLYDPQTGSMGATLQTMLEQTETPIEGGLGSLSWNLLSITEFRVGSNLNVTFKIHNPSASERLYRIYLGLFDHSGGVLTTWSLGEDILVAAQSAKSVFASLPLAYSDCRLQAALYNVETGGMSRALETVLVSPEPPPDPSEQVAPFTSFLSRIMVLSLVSKMVSDTLGTEGDYGVLW